VHGVPHNVLHTRAAITLVAGLFGVLTVSSGLGFYNLSLYMNVLADARDLPVTVLSGATSVFFLVGGVAGLVVGRLLQEVDARWIIAAGGVIGGSALAAIGHADSPAAVIALYGLFGIGNTAVGLLPATTLVTRWFDADRRAVALSITSTGLSLGGVLFTPASAWLLARAEVEVAMPLLGALYVVGIAPLALLTVRSYPDGHADRSTASTLAGVPYTAAVRSRFFGFLTAAYVLLMAAQVGGIAHLYSRGVEIASSIDAAFAVSVLAALSISGRLLGGWLLSLVPIRGFTLVNVAGQAAGLAALVFCEYALGLWIAAAVFGATVGNLLMLQPLLLGQAFGLRDYPRIFSTSQAITTLGVGGGPLLMGLVRSTASYEIAFAGATAASLVALALVLVAGQVRSG
jgi:hypothetical protein